MKLNELPAGALLGADALAARKCAIELSDKFGFITQAMMLRYGRIAYGVGARAP